MTTVPVGALLLVAALAVALAVVLSAGETALARLGRSGLADVAAGGGPGADRASRLAQDPHDMAAAGAWVRVHAEVVAVVALTLALVGAGLSWWQALLAAVVLGVVLAVLVVRWLPRGLARRHPRGAVGVGSVPLLLAWTLTVPVRSLAHAAAATTDPTEDEIREMVERVNESERIEEEDRELVRSVLELGDTRVRAVMVPRTEMVTLPAGTSVGKAMSLFVRSGFSRIPVAGESVDDLLGVLYLKDLLRHRHLSGADDDGPIDPLVRPAAFVPESKAADDLLREMQRTASHIAMVVDEYGGIAGLVTIEDVLEEIVGELIDEHDRTGQPEVEDLGDGAYRVPARLPVDELGELFDLDLQDEDVDTVAGLLAKALGKVPLAGSSAQVGPLALTADRVEGRRRQLATVLARRAEPAEGDDVTRADQGASR